MRFKKLFITIDSFVFFFGFVLGTVSSVIPFDSACYSAYFEKIHSANMVFTLPNLYLICFTPDKIYMNSGVMIYNVVVNSLSLTSIIQKRINKY